MTGRRPIDRRAKAWQWIDLRLVPPAATIWATTLVAPMVPRQALAAAGAGAAALAALLGVLLARRRPAPAAGVAVAVLAALAVTAALATLRVSARETSALHAAAGAERQVTVELRLDSEFRQLSRSRAPRLLAEATVIGVDQTAGRLAVHDPVLLIADGNWPGVVPGETVRARVQASLPSSQDDVVAILSARGPPDPLAEPAWWQRGAAAIRGGLSDTAHRVLDDGPAGLLPGLVVGDTHALDPVLAEDFRTAGLTHLVAVSGANVAIVLAGVLWPLRRRGASRWLQSSVGGLALTGFVVLAQPGASVLRAAAMGAVGLLALATGRARAAVPALAATVGVLLLVQPGLAKDAGFALSVAATAAIVLLARPWSAALRRRGVPSLVADALAVSAAAGAATAPLLAALSGQVSLVSLPANLIAAPAVAPATVLGLITAVLAPVVPAAADLVAWLAGWPVRWLVLVARRAAALPDAVVGWPAGAPGATLLTLLLLAVAAAVWRSSRLRPLFLAALLAVLVVGWPLRQAVRGWPPPDADVIACDVGQGDALVIPTGPGSGVLVDVGPEPAAIDRCLRRLGIGEVPLVLLSHLDADHAAGLPGALAGRQVAEVATAALPPADLRVARIDTLAQRAGARRSTLGPGDHRDVGTAVIEVLAPPARTATVAAQPNDLSMVVRATSRGVRTLFTGDLGAEAQARILSRGLDLQADVLKVPHHGSADADPAFLAASGARVALISVGAGNSYGHPTARTLSWLAQDGMQVHRTDREGDLAVVGSAGNWGIGAQKAAASGSPGDPPPGKPGKGGPPADTATLAPVSSAARRCRRRVAACQSARHASFAHLPLAGRRGGGGAAAVARRRSGPVGGSRAPP